MVVNLTPRPTPPATPVPSGPPPPLQTTNYGPTPRAALSAIRRCEPDNFPDATTLALTPAACPPDLLTPVQSLLLPLLTYNRLSQTQTLLILVHPSNHKLSHSLSVPSMRCSNPQIDDSFCNRISLRLPSAMVQTVRQTVPSAQANHRLKPASHNQVVSHSIRPTSAPLPRLPPIQLAATAFQQSPFLSSLDSAEFRSSRRTSGAERSHQGSSTIPSQPR